MVWRGASVGFSRSAARSPCAQVQPDGSNRLSSLAGEGEASHPDLAALPMPGLLHWAAIRRVRRLRCDIESAPVVDWLRCAWQAPRHEKFDLGQKVFFLTAWAHLASAAQSSRWLRGGRFARAADGRPTRSQNRTSRSGKHHRCRPSMDGIQRPSWPSGRPCLSPSAAGHPGAQMGQASVIDGPA